MENYKSLPTEQLLELISKYTIDCARMLKEGAPKKEHSECEDFLILLHEEMQFRRSKFYSTDIKFEEGSS